MIGQACKSISGSLQSTCPCLPPHHTTLFLPRCLQRLHLAIGDRPLLQVNIQEDYQFKWQLFHDGFYIRNASVTVDFPLARKECVLYYFNHHNAWNKYHMISVPSLISQKRETVMHHSVHDTEGPFRLLPNSLNCKSNMEWRDLVGEHS